MTADPAGRVYLAWVDDHAGPRQVHLALWDGSRWTDLGGSSAGGGISGTTGESRLGDLAIDRQGRPVVTWMDSSPLLGSIYLRRWSGSSWEELGGSATGRGISGPENPWWPSLVLDAQDRPVVAWETYNIMPEGAIYLKRWSGQSWVEVAGSATDHGTAQAGARSARPWRPAASPPPPWTPGGRTWRAQPTGCSWHGSRPSPGRISRRTCAGGRADPAGGTLNRGRSIMIRGSRWDGRTVRAVVTLAALTVGVACNDEGGFQNRPDTDGVVSDLDSGLSFTDLPHSITVVPVNPQVVVETGKPIPTVQFKAQMGSATVPAKWSLDRGELGTLASTGLFTPSGDLGGQATITATVGSLSATTQVTVLLRMTQNGATQQNGNPGPGGFGGVGGEGLGPAVDATVVALLDGPSTAASLTLLYPYDKTVWPIGILAPLLQWSALPAGLGDGVRIELSSTHFQFKGYFGRPAALASTAALVRHPVPQDVWKAATQSAAGESLTLKVVVASSGTVYGPLSATWTVASGRLKGTVYYQSYGTNLAKNYTGAMGGDGTFGGATLAIKGGSTDPVLVAGKSGTTADCRVCHSVASGGSRMVVQHGDNYKATSSYDLLNAYAETPYPASTVGQLGWIGLTPDGKLGLGNAVPIPGGANSGATALYDMTTGAAVTAPGLSSFVTHAGFPMFSGDGKQVAFTFYAGPGDAATGPGDSNKLVVMGFDAATSTFANPRLAYQGSASSRPGWPAFWPTARALAFAVELPGNTSGEYFATRYGARGELWWVDLASGTARPLDRLNGKIGGVSYLPTGPGNHADDTTLSYEPTVSPIASGGYAWIVFVSRRMYGNVATIDPWWSDPREHDLTQTPTPKKMWVAALDLNPKPGTDPSHPPFYLPAQELMAGNSRGFWVIDPCKPDGQPCEGGDECCGGYCVPVPGSTEMVCGKTAVGCAQEFDKCQQNTDCCDYPKFQCVNGHCARWGID